MKSRLFGYLTLLLTILTVVACEEDDADKPAPAAAFTVSQTTAKIGEDILFTNTSENATAFKWSFGDGTTSKEISPKKAYGSAGKFVVTLLTTGAGGSTLSSAEIVIVPDPQIYYTEIDASMIRHFGINSTDKVTDFLDVSGIAGPGLAFDPENEKVYFSDFSVDGEGKIWRVNLDGTDLEEIVGGLNIPHQVALDLEAGKIYWGEDVDGDDLGHVGRANLDGTGREYLVDVAEAAFTGLALDAENNKMYFYDAWNENLYVSNLDGTEATIIFPGIFGYGILVDAVNDKLYFDDREAGLLLRSDLDGSNVETVDNNASRIYGMAIDHESGKLYWSDRDSGEIIQANLDGSHKVVLKSGLSSPRGLFFKK